MSEMQWLSEWEASIHAIGRARVFVRVYFVGPQSEKNTKFMYTFFLYSFGLAVVLGIFQYCRVSMWCLCTHKTEHKPL